MPDGATWGDPDLFWAMPAPGSLPGHDIEWTSPPAGLPFNATVDARWGPHNLTAVQAEPAGDDGIRFELDGLGFLQAVRGNWSHPADFERALASFVANVSAATPEIRDEYVAHILRSERDDPGYLSVDHEGNVRGHSIAYQGPAPYPFRFEALLEGLRASPSFDASDSHVSAEGWLLSFALATKSVAQRPDEAGGFRLQVDPRGEAAFSGLYDGEQSEERYRSRLLAKLDDLGLPKPDPADLHVGGAIC